jgi:alcohol dehydrogenase class IV
MAISTTRTAAAHALSYALTMRFGISHGKAVSTLLSQVLRASWKGFSPERQKRLASAWGAEPGEDVSSRVEAFGKRHHLGQRLGESGVTSEDLAGLVQAAIVPGRLDNHAAVLNPSQLEAILEACL